MFDEGVHEGQEVLKLFSTIEKSRKKMVAFANIIIKRMHVIGDDGQTGVIKQAIISILVSYYKFDNERVGNMLL